MSLVAHNENTSPFDSIRRTDEQGEYWLARDLMPLLGYERWDRVPETVERAMTACTNSGNSVADHFSEEARKSQGKGRPRQDFRFSRYGSYLVAMNGDPRKPEIASAQSYFAIKAREAEVIIPAQSQAMAEMDKQIEILKLQNENLNATLQLRHLDNNMLTMHGAELVLTLRGKSDQLVRVETVVTEVVNPKTGNTDRILTADQLKQIIMQNTGQKIPSMKWFTDKIKEKNREDLLMPVTRHQTSEYVIPEALAEAIALVFGENRQLLLGE